jgi:hypothetical protein
VYLTVEHDDELNRIVCSTPIANFAPLIVTNVPPSRGPNSGVMLKKTGFCIKKNKAIMVHFNAAECKIHE